MLMNPVFKRTVTGLATAAAIICAFIWVPVKVLVPLMIAVIGLVHLEFSKLVSRKYEIMVLPGVFCGLLYLITSVYARNASQLLILIVFVLSLTAMFSRSNKPIVAVATTLLGFLYIPVMLTPFVLIPYSFGWKWLLYVVAIIKISDMGGFAFGVAFGKHKMCPSISPNKSWEGMFGSIFASCLISCCLMKLTNLSFAVSLAFGFAAAIIGTLGDLVESRFKRDVGVKDSSVFMPAGMGGFLDMFDSLIFAPAIFYYFISSYAA
jgi:phosphatidate cytidylyltransferase